MQSLPLGETPQHFRAVIRQRSDPHACLAVSFLLLSQFDENLKRCRLGDQWAGVEVEV